MIKLVVTVLLLLPTLGFGESQENEYKGITDPFGDPANYEFAEDEKEDKEFFHLGRYLMLGVDLGIGVFTGGLGKTASPAFNFGGKVLYFFDRLVAFEGSLHYSRHQDLVQNASNPSIYIDIDVGLLPLMVGLRYYFDVKNAPKAISIANPYIGLGGGMYIRTQNVVGSQGVAVSIGNSASNHFGFYGAAGIEFPIYRKYLYLGTDVRYHFIFFSDADDTLNGLVPRGQRSGGYFNAYATITYNF